MNKVKVQQLEAAIQYLKQARKQVQLALGDTDSAQMTVADINIIMEDLDADIVFLQDGVPRKKSVIIHTSTTGEADADN